MIFEQGDRRLEAGGLQPVEAYDVVIGNLDPTLRRQPAPETPEPLLGRFPLGLTTQEVAAEGLTEPHVSRYHSARATGPR